jgi:hypothetical protein
MSDAADPFEFLKSLWNPMGLPMGSMATPTLSVPELEKRITDLKLVENWLNMNLATLRMSIQALEMQKAAIEAMQKAQGPDSPASQALEAWMKMMQAAASGAPGAPPDPGKKK